MPDPFKMLARPLKGPILLLLPFLFVQCEKEQMGDCFKGKGERVQEEREVSGFSTIVLHDHIRLILDPGKEEGVTLEAGENLIPLIKTERKGDRLILRNDNTCNWARSYDGVIEARVGFEDLDRLEYRGTAGIRTNGTIRTESFRFDQWKGMGDVALQLECDTAYLKLHTGAGDLSCEGSAEWSYLFGGGKGFMRLENFPTDKVHAVSDASGDIRLNVVEKLWAETRSLGSIFYYGDGELVESERTGSGKVERKK